MKIRELSVPGSFEITPVQHHDSRGVFLELFKGPALAEAIGHPFELQQANCSVSAAGSLRGIHFADVPPGQAKYVTCLTGSVYDVVVDIRVGSPTFGAWDAVLLDPRDRRAVYVPEGWGTVSSHSRMTPRWSISAPPDMPPAASTASIRWTQQLGSSGRPVGPTAPSCHYSFPKRTVLHRHCWMPGIRVYCPMPPKCRLSLTACPADRSRHQRHIVFAKVPT